MKGSINYRDRYEMWLNEPAFDEDFIALLKKIPEDELEESFYRELEFGTAGLRGINGAGSNRMNKYIIRRATQAYSQYLRLNSNNPSCVIAYDNRRYSRYFAMQAAGVLAANGVKTYIFEELRPTPELSFAVRELKTTGGIVCTASHNPPEYSGYKVYGDDGCQLNTASAGVISKFISEQDGFSSIKYMDFEDALAVGSVQFVGDELDRAFIAAVQKQVLHAETLSTELKTVYTPLHGAGGYIMKTLFEDMGIDDVYYLKEQMQPDPEFTTCKIPNPEEESSFELSKKYGAEIGAELLVACDPDADRLGCLLRSAGGEYKKINGNQIGALMAYYLFSEKRDMPKSPCMVKSIVTSDLTEHIAKDYGIAFKETLTGFKNICGIIREFERDGSYDFIMGFEESYGYIVGDHCRDKDSIVSAMFLIDMAKFYKSRGKSLFDVLDEIYAKYGYFADDLISMVKPGKSGMEEIAALMAKFRASFKDELKSRGLTHIYDYESLTIENLADGSAGRIDEEKSNVLKFKLSSGSWIAMRPSGTEPKIKFYFSVRGSGEEEAKRELKELRELVTDFMN